MKVFSDATGSQFSLKSEDAHVVISVAAQIN